MSTALTPSSDYQFPPEPAEAILDRAIWNAVHLSIGQRLRELEAQRTDLEDLINDLSFNGQARIDAAITPLIDEQKRVLAALGPQIDNLKARVEQILAGGVPAADVAESATRVFVTPQQKALIGALDADLTILEASFKTWSDAYPIPASGNSSKFLRVNSDGTALEFAVVDLFSAALINRIPRTSNTALAKADKGSLVDVTAGTFVQTFVAAATLGAGWYAYIRNSGTGDITLDPNGSETIDGLTTFIMYPGEARLIQCDGTALRSVVLTPGTKTFDSSGNLIWPPGVNGAIVDVVGGGGGGGKGAAGSNSPISSGDGGGGGGREKDVVVPAQAAGTATQAVVGAGGSGASGVSAGIGGTGGNSSFGRFAGAFGGSGGSFNASGALGGAGSIVLGRTQVPTERNGGGGGLGRNGSIGIGGDATDSVYAASGGGGGGAASNDAQNGRAGGGGGRTPSGMSAYSTAAAGGTSASPNGQNGADAVSGFAGNGGGGGFGTYNGVGGNGGNGGYPGGGGGGGGGSYTSTPGTAGNGGNGGAGRIIVRFF